MAIQSLEFYFDFELDSGFAVAVKAERNLKCNSVFYKTSINGEPAVAGIVCPADAGEDKIKEKIIGWYADHPI